MTVTIQKTSKSLKAQKAIGFFMLIATSIWLVASMEEGNTTIPVLSITASAIFYAQARIRTWWNHH